MPFFSAHTPTDNLVVDYLDKCFAEQEPQLIEDVQKALLEVPEYRIAAQKGAGPYIGKSSGGTRAGKIWVDMTGGTEGPKKVIEKLADNGVGTIVGMHMGPELREEADKHHIHVVIAGHIESDSLGINLFMDELERKAVSRRSPTAGSSACTATSAARSSSEEPGALPPRWRRRRRDRQSCTTVRELELLAPAGGPRALRRPSPPAPTPSTSASTRWSARAFAGNFGGEAVPAGRRDAPTCTTRARTWRSTRCSRTTRSSRRSRRWRRRTSPASTRSSSPTSASPRACASATPSCRCTPAPS